VAILREVDTQGKSIEETCKCHKVSVQTFYLWRRRFGSLQENEVKRLREMEKENARLKRLLAERDLELDVVREFLKKVAGAAERRKAVGFLTAGGLYVRRSCAILRNNRSSLGYLPLKDDSALVQKLKELAGRNPCHG
jgi:putative transposase